MIHHDTSWYLPINMVFSQQPRTPAARPRTCCAWPSCSRTRRRSSRPLSSFRPRMRRDRNGDPGIVSWGEKHRENHGKRLISAWNMGISWDFTNSKCYLYGIFELLFMMKIAWEAINLYTSIYMVFWWDLPTIDDHFSSKHGHLTMDIVLGDHPMDNGDGVHGDVVMFSGY